MTSSAPHRTLATSAGPSIARRVERVSPFLAMDVLSAAAALPRRVGPDRASLAFQVRLWCRLAAAWPPYIWRRCRLIRTGERPQG